VCVSVCVYVKVDVCVCVSGCVCVCLGVNVCLWLCNIVSLCLFIQLDNNLGSGRLSEKIGPRQQFLCKVAKHLTILGEEPAATNNVISSF